MTSSAVYLYIPCGMKKRSFSEPVRLDGVASEVGPCSIPELVDAWVETVWRKQFEKFPFEETYLGGVWGLIRKHGSPERTSVFAVSAGYGLLPPNSGISNYDATFAPNVKNSVASKVRRASRNPRRIWWGLLGKAARLDGRPSKISDMVRDEPGIHIVALPRYYLDAVWEDLCEVLSQPQFANRLLLLITRTSVQGLDCSRAVIVPSGVRKALGGTVGTVLSRTALHIARVLGSRASDMARVKAVIRNLDGADYMMPRREYRTDEQLRKYIRTYLRKYPSSKGYTSALRQLRKDGYASEMKRFKELYLEIVSRFNNLQ